MVAPWGKRALGRDAAARTAEPRLGRARMSEASGPSVMPLADALAVFRALGIDVTTLTRSEFKKTYYRLALEHQNRRDSHDLMAHINLARASINKLHRWKSE